ncbi:MAG: trimeric intracellular cation channel family protein [Bacteroidetes bacterium]|nr:trimeric intracellular cation channel family protein [Bacteroidota bacterium]MBU1117269.1 trimeric intracellular cation channel family protein [Bacteroidota bacterium]MBU1800075.1 trimeric intracellular cation channel family protein [Bacteroidota bacterium]
MLYWLDLFGVSVFAISGVLAAGKKQMDPFGAIILGIVTALGGGTLRDLLLGSTPVFWVINPTYIILSIVTSFITLLISNKIKFPYKVLVVADAFGLTLFAVLGVQKSIMLGHGAWISIIMGMLSGVAGGITRDVLSNEIPLIFRKELYATIALLSGILFYVTESLNISTNLGMILSVLLGFGLRLFALKKKLSLPRFDYRKE